MKLVEEFLQATITCTGAQYWAAVPPTQAWEYTCTSICTGCTYQLEIISSSPMYRHPW